MTSQQLQERLNINLMKRLNGRGSTLYSMTWKVQITPAQRLLFRLRASVLRTSETERTGWVTRAARDWKDSASDIAPRADGKERFDQLPRQANLAGWTTPAASDAERGGTGITPGMTGSSLTQQVMVAGWPTPTCNVKDQPTTQRGIETLAGMAAMTGPARLTATGQLLTGFTAGMASGGQLNPHMSRWLMGIPKAWAECGPGYLDWIQWQKFMKKV